MTIEQYLQSINTRFKLGNSTEHTFRGDLQQLIEALSPGFRATNEPKRQSCGAPDYIITRKDIPVGFIEAKDIGAEILKGSRSSEIKSNLSVTRHPWTTLSSQIICISYFIGIVSLF